MDLSLYSGDSRSLQITVTDDIENVIDITGANIRFVLGQNQVVMLEKNSQDGGVLLTDPKNGLFTVNVLSRDTQALNGAYDYAIRLTDASGNSSIILNGIFNVTKSYI
ncbi:MAG: hypothetical protein Q8910_00905 [Bacteroidota bacterium]|nr:hypothetical protein [Bacteroidota bacterium]